VNDPLGEALHYLRMQGTFYCRSELTAPWGLTMPPMPGHLWFHVVTDGRCVIEAGRFGPVDVAPGDFVLVPQGEGHVLRTDSDAPAPDVIELPQQLVGDHYSMLQHGGGGTPTTLVCGVVRFDHHSAHDLVRLLPPVIHLDARALPHSDWIQSTLRLMADEAKALRPGGETIVTRLADVLVVQAIRSWLERAPEAQIGWLGALRDQQLGHAIALVHRDPAHDWSVGSLAAAVAMSRSSFAARFTELVGEPPMQYVTRSRMRMASRLLQHEACTIAEVASRLGYQSEAAFSRAFKRFVGISPGAARRSCSRQ
jgi:AraC-like DNA-binding protein